MDVVDTGGTLRALVSIMHAWTEEAGVEWRGVARKVRLVVVRSGGLVERGLAAELGRQRAMRETWFRSLVLEIERGSVPTS